MEREALLAILAAGLSGPVLWLAAALVAVRRTALESPGAAPRAWHRLVLPLAAGGAVLAFLAGWALQEPDPADEWAGLLIVLLAGATAAVAARAIWRAAAALRSSGRVHLAVGTRGLVKPRPVVSAAFRRAVAPQVLEAALAHERAHVRGRDPLRMWLAQLAADLQWPVPGPRRRLEAWLLALEFRRDAEAVAAGACPLALAEAILEAVRLQKDRRPRRGAAVAGAASGVALRVRLLLEEDRLERPCDPRPRVSLLCRVLPAVLVGAGWLGVAYGETILRLLPGILC